METHTGAIKSKPRSLRAIDHFNAPVFPARRCTVRCDEIIRELQKENVRWKRMYEELSLDHRILKEIILKKIGRSMEKNERFRK